MAHRYTNISMIWPKDNPAGFVWGAFIEILTFIELTFIKERPADFDSKVLTHCSMF